MNSTEQELLNRIIELEKRLAFEERIERLAYTDWTSYTPTITYGGGTTDPTSFGTSLNYAIIGNVCILTGLFTINIGSGDRAYTLLTVPVLYTQEFAGAAAGVWTLTEQNCAFYSAFTNKIFFDHPTMPADSTTYFVRVSATYKI